MTNNRFSKIAKIATVTLSLGFAAVTTAHASTSTNFAEGSGPSAASTSYIQLADGHKGSQKGSQKGEDKMKDSKKGSQKGKDKMKDSPKGSQKGSQKGY